MYKGACKKKTNMHRAMQEYIRTGRKLTDICGNILAEQWISWLPKGLQVRLRRQDTAPVLCFVQINLTTIARYDIFLNR